MSRLATEPQALRTLHSCVPAPHRTDGNAEATNRDFNFPGHGREHLLRARAIDQVRAGGRVGVLDNPAPAYQDNACTNPLSELAHPKITLESLARSERLHVERA